MPLPAAEIERRIKSALPDAEISILDLAGDDDHFEVTVTSPSFSGKTRVAQHRMVFDAIGGDMGTTLHALAVKTKIPA